MRQCWSFWREWRWQEERMRKEGCLYFTASFLFPSERKKHFDISDKKYIWWISRAFWWRTLQQFTRHSILPIWVKTFAFHATIAMNKPAFAGVSIRTTVLPSLPFGRCVFSGKMAFALNKITFHAFLAFGYFCSTLRGKKVTQVIFVLMKISSRIFFLFEPLFCFSFEKEGVEFRFII